MIAQTKAQSNNSAERTHHEKAGSACFLASRCDAEGHASVGPLKASYLSVRRRWSKTVCLVNDWLDAA